MTQTFRSTLLATAGAAAALLLALPGGAADAGDKPTSIKLTTLAPSGSSFHKALQRMGQEWSKATDGKIRLDIYAGSVQGGESAMVQRMRVGQTHAGLLTAVGLSEIVPEVTGLQSMPMMFRSLAEVDHVGEKLQGKLEKLLADKGFVVLFWTDAGWVRFFSRTKVVHPDDLRALKIFSWAGHPDEEDLYKSAGFRPVPLETADILTSLQTGLIDAVPMPPLAANFGLVYGPAPHMLEINWAPLVGACVVTKKAWDKFDAATQESLLKAARDVGKEVKAIGRKENDDAAAAMKEKWNLDIQTMTPEVEAEWRALAESVYPKIRGKIVPAEIFDEVQRVLKELRAPPADGAGK